MAAKFSIATPGIKAEPHLAAEFREEVARLLERKSLSFPGAQPVSFARRHLEELTKQEYVLCSPVHFVPTNEFFNCGPFYLQAALERC